MICRGVASRPGCLGRGGLPGLLPAGDAQVGDVEGAQPRLGAGPGAGGALVADLAADAGGGPGPGGDRGGVVVGLHLAEDVGLPVAEAVPEAVAVRAEDLGGEALDDPGVVGVCLDGVLGVGGVGVADHVEEGALLAPAVDDPGGVEDLVPAVLGVDVGEHDQLDVGGVAPQAEIGVGEVVDLPGRQGQPPAGVGLHEGRAPVAAEGHRLQGAGLVAREEALRVGGRGFDHAVVQEGPHRRRDPGPPRRGGSSGCRAPGGPPRRRS